MTVKYDGIHFLCCKKRVQQKEEKKMLVLIAGDGGKVIGGREWLSALSYQLMSKSKQKSVNVIEIETEASQLDESTNLSVEGEITERIKRKFGDLFHRDKQIESYHIETEVKKSLTSPSRKSQNFLKRLQIAVENY